jgi:hypothetical protein
MKCHILKPKESSKKTVVADGAKASPLSRKLKGTEGLKSNQIG